MRLNLERNIIRVLRVKKKKKNKMQKYEPEAVHYTFRLTNCLNIQTVSLLSI